MPAGEPSTQGAGSAKWRPRSLRTRRGVRTTSASVPTVATCSLLATTCDRSTAPVGVERGRLPSGKRGRVRLRGAAGSCGHVGYAGRTTTRRTSRTGTRRLRSRARHAASQSSSASLASGARCARTVVVTSCGGHVLRLSCRSGLGRSSARCLRCLRRGRRRLPSMSSPRVDEGSRAGSALGAARRTCSTSGPRAWSLGLARGTAARGGRRPMGASSDLRWCSVCGSTSGTGMSARSAGRLPTHLPILGVTGTRRWITSSLGRRADRTMTTTCGLRIAGATRPVETSRTTPTTTSRPRGMCHG